MANLRIKGDVSGYVDLVSPDVAGSTTIALDKIVTLDANGNLGVGTSGTPKKLTVESSTQYDGLLVTNGSNYIAELVGFSATNDAGGLKLRNNGTATVEVHSSGTTFFNGGNVGIGTSSPSSPLHVETTSQRVGTFISTGSDPQIYLGDAASSDNAIILGYDRADNRGYLTVAGDGDNVFTVTNGGNIGIGTTNPEAKLHVAGQILAGSGAGTNLILDDGAESAKWGFATGGYNLTFQKNNGSGVYQERGRIDQNGNFTVPGYISGGPGSVVQEVVMETNVLTSFSTVNAWGEPSTSYRLNITPKFSNSLIVLHYFVPLNQSTSGANNIFLFRTVRYSPNSSHFITSVGQQAGGSRMRVAGGAARAQNGYDANDQNLESWIAYDRPSTTSQCTYGFEMKQESSDSGTIYIAHSSSDNGTWGYASRVIITAREIRQ